MRKSLQKGFTLIELLLVIGIISVLAVVVFVALNPAQRFKDARDARRVQDTQAILTAIHEYIIDNKGALPAGLTAGMSEAQLGTNGSGCAVTTGGCNTAAACVNLTTPLVKYLKSIPTDPNGGASTATGYSAVVDANNLVTIRACNTEGTTNISASR